VFRYYNIIIPIYGHISYLETIKFNTDKLQTRRLHPVIDLEKYKYNIEGWLCLYFWNKSASISLYTLLNVYTPFNQIPLFSLYEKIFINNQFITWKIAINYYEILVEVILLTILIIRIIIKYRYCVVSFDFVFKFFPIFCFWFISVLWNIKISLFLSA